MRAHRKIICGLAIGSLSLVGVAPFTSAADAPADSTMSQPAATAAPTLPAGFTAKQADTNGVRKALARVTDHAVTKDGFSKLAGDLVNQDQDRVEQYKNPDSAKLDGRIAELQKAWKAKYGHDFDIDKATAVFNDTVPIVRGEVSDPAVAMANWPVAVTGREAMTAGERAPAANGDAEKKIDKGREVALVRIPAANGLPEMTISMLLQHPDHWVIDIPNDRTGQQVFEDLLNHVTYLGEHAETWPSDVNDGYRMFAQHTIAALYGLPTQSKKG